MADRRRVALALKERYQEALDSGLGATAVDEPRNLTKIVERAMPVAEAAAYGEPTFEEILA